MLKFEKKKIHELLSKQKIGTYHTIHYSAIFFFF